LFGVQPLIVTPALFLQNLCIVCFGFGAPFPQHSFIEFFSPLWVWIDTVLPQESWFESFDDLALAFCVWYHNQNSKLTKALFQNYKPTTLGHV
jgi:hypothetical protein